ncbi:MAG: HIRAN domain-containing protein [Clostridiales bacterium]|nr:HIRAN domain-containing protein [Clostridiales bacterium]
MKDVYITIAGARHYYGLEIFKKGMTVALVKEPDNEVDAEAIKVMLDGLGKVGYVANSPYTTLGESLSAGRLYDRVRKHARAEVVTITPKGVLCRVRKKSLK